MFSFIDWIFGGVYEKNEGSRGLERQNEAVVKNMDGVVLQTGFKA